MAHANKIHFYNDPKINLIEVSEWDKQKTLSSNLKNLIAAVLDMPTEKIELEHPADQSHGDYSTNIAMLMAKETNTNPRELAASYVSKLETSVKLKSYIETLQVAGPGFINLTLKRSVLIESAIAALNNNFGSTELLKDKTIMFEYAHPNPFKAFHIGHLRNIILGESLIRILEKNGANIIRVNYQGDVGMHIAKCIWALKQIDPKDYPNDIDGRIKMIAESYTKGANAFKDDETIKTEIVSINKLIYSKTDPEINRLWELGKKWSLDKFHRIYERVYSTFEREYMESETLELAAKEIKRAIDSKILEKSQGAIIFNGEGHKVDTRVFLNSEGLPTYEGKELGLGKLKYQEFGDVDLHIHNVAVEQIGYFKVVFTVQQLLDPELFKGKQYHNAYEFVGLKSGKMSSRTGNVVLGEDILNIAEKSISEVIKDKTEFSSEEKTAIAEKVGIGAVKYSFLNINPGTYLAFDLESSLSFEGNSGPYLQYTFARASRILEDSTNNLAGIDKEVLNNLESAEAIAVLRTIYRFPEVVIESAKLLAPNHISTYLFELAQAFNSFYKADPILKEDDETLKQARLLLTQTVANILAQGLDLLGIKTVARM